MSLAPISNADPMFALAELLINTDYQRSELDRQNLQAAREAQTEAANRQVEALHDGADHVAAGAWVQGGLSVAGSLASGSSILLDSAATSLAEHTTARLLDGAGDALKSVAAPAGELVGTAPRLHADARAQAAAQAAKQAEWEMDDAREHQRRVAAHSDKILEAAADVVETKNGGELAIIAKL